MDPLEEALRELPRGEFERRVNAVAATRSDAWENEITGFGTTQDKTTYTSYGGSVLLGDQQVSNLYHGDDLAARMVDIVPDEMLREGFSVDTGDAAQNAALADALEDLGVRGQLANGIRWGRLYGGAALLMGADDGRPAAMPLVPERAKSVRYLYELDRRYLWPQTYYREPGHKKLGRPETYLVSPTGQTMGSYAVVHETRLLIFGGATTGLREQELNQAWDHSVLQRAFDALRGFNTGFKAAEILLTDGNQAVLKVRNLEKMIGAGGEELARRRMMLVDMYRSVMRALVVDAGTKDVPSEDFIRHSVSYSGIPEMLDRFMLRLSAAVQIPVTILMGQSPAGMNATGESDFRWFYNRIRSQQTLELAPVIRRLVRVMLATAGGEARQINVTFPPLWSEPPEKEAARRLQNATADVAYVNAGILTPEEVALSRFGQGKYGEDIVLSDEAIEARNDMLIASLEGMETDEGAPANAEVETDPDAEATKLDAAELIESIAGCERCIIAGGPRTGKSTLAVRAGERFKRAVKHADSLVGVKQWSDASEAVSRWFDEPGSWIVEGVAAPRALRKWLAANPGKRLDATVLYLRDPIQVRSKGQAAMAKGVHTVWREILPELQDRGVTVVERDS